jgi:hypothetical protein
MKKNGDMRGTLSLSLTERLQLVVYAPVWQICQQEKGGRPSLHAAKQHAMYQIQLNQATAIASTDYLVVQKTACLYKRKWVPHNTITNAKKHLL